MPIRASALLRKNFYLFPIAGGATSGTGHHLLGGACVVPPRHLLGMGRPSTVSPIATTIRSFSTSSVVCCPLSPPPPPPLPSTCSPPSHLPSPLDIGVEFTAASADVGPASTHPGDGSMLHPFGDSFGSSGGHGGTPPPTKVFDEPELAHHASIHNEYLGFFFRTVEWRAHPDKAATGGEDSYMATDYALGVADGVGWWDQLDDKKNTAGRSGTELVRSAAQQYSETFMRAAFEFCEEEYLGQGEVPVEKLVSYAYEHSLQCKKGSCTATFATVVNNNLQVYNLGDSALMLIRCGKVIFRTEDKSHGLNFPFQLGVGSKDRPSDGVLNQIKIRRGDVIVMGSDGIFDNVFEEDIINILKKHDEKNLSTKIRMLGLVDSEQQYEHILQTDRRSASARAAAGAHAQQILKAAGHEIVRLAVSNVNDPRANTPFAMKCVENGAYHEGGKQDDMTLVMASVASSLMSEGVRFGTSDFGEVPPPYKNWPASTQYID